MQILEKYKIPISLTIREAIKLMDQAGIGFSVCVGDDDLVIGVISDGDFRRAILDGIDLGANVSKIVNRDFRYVGKEYKRQQVEKIFQDDVARHVPVILNGKLEEIITERDFFGIRKNIKKRILNNKVIIMAGGKGTRLDPFTKILPKPLIPFGNDPVIKVIMDEFNKHGMSNFYISLNEKGRMIKAYFYDHDFKYSLNYIEEKEFLGTAGALKFLKGSITEAFFVSNCDVIIKADYASVYDFHKHGNYDLTLIGSMQQYTIPYGVCDIAGGGALKSIREKPRYDLLVNTGLYLMNPAVLDFIPENKSYDMTDLINSLKENGKDVGVFPVSEKSWIDIGQWNEYNKNIENQNEL
jgi:dTDP-glucose pyrophosphorylase